MNHHKSPAITQQRISKWLMQAKSVEQNPTWTETRQAIQFGEHTYILNKNQVFVCGHCGSFDPEWSATEVIDFFRDMYGIKPTEITVQVSVAVSDDS